MIQSTRCLATAPDLREKLSHSARDRAITKFDHKLVAGQYEKLYREMAEAFENRTSEAKIFSLSIVPEIILTNDFLAAETIKLNTDKLKDDQLKNHTSNEFVPVSGSNPVTGSIVNSFSELTYSKKSHFKLFKGSDLELYHRSIDPALCDLKAYQDLLVFWFIKNVIPKGSRILDIGGGESRILAHFKDDFECWNLDKLEGLGNGPRNIKTNGYRLVKDYIGNFNLELPNNYFDFVFSISALEHVPDYDPALLQKILDDIDRILKSGGYSLHCFDVVLKETSAWTNKLLPFLFDHLNYQ
ncbi:MAG: methyltransferase domain-containing protein [Anaerolineales bacterium]|nr:methyltransferase domain-containing protein [Anaerolineales bacterium]